MSHSHTKEKKPSFGFWGAVGMIAGFIGSLASAWIKLALLVASFGVAAWGVGVYKNMTRPVYYYVERQIALPTPVAQGKGELCSFDGPDADEEECVTRKLGLATWEPVGGCMWVWNPAGKKYLECPGDTETPVFHFTSGETWKFCRAEQDTIGVRIKE